jgi:RNA polymerase sigma factor (sigma-70 family)
MSESASGRVLPLTSWTLISAARSGSPGASAALNEFSKRYYRPIHAYLLAIASRNEDVADITQGFFTDVIVTGGLLKWADRARPFRPYLKQSLRNYVISMRRKRAAAKRIPEQIVDRPDAEESAGWDHIDLRQQADGEAAFHDAWVRELLKTALDRFEKACRDRNQQQHFELFTRHYLRQGDGESWKDLGDEFGIDQKIARSRAQTAARRFGSALRDLLVEQLGSEQDARQEVQMMASLLLEVHG